MRDVGIREERLAMLCLPHVAPLNLLVQDLHARSGSGFISRDNDDPTAEATYRFMVQVRLHRESTILWNVVPGWNGTRKITGPEHRAGVVAAIELTRLLPKLKIVVLVGNKAARSLPLIESAGFKVMVSDHPSPIVRATRRDRWDAIPEA